MTEFDIYTKQVEVGGKELKLRPLDGKHLPKMWAILTSTDDSSKLSKQELDKLSDEEKADLVKGMFTEENMTTIYQLCLHTMERSYPNKDEEGIKDFTSLNLMELFNVITDINMSRASGLTE